KNAYLELRKYTDSGYVEQEFSFGKSEKIQTKDEIEKWLSRADSAFNNFKTYQTKSKGYEKLANRDLFVIKSEMNFDSFSQAEYKGVYTILMTIIPSNKQPNGVSVSVVTKSGADSIRNSDEMNNIVRTLEFIKE